MKILKKNVLREWVDLINESDNSYLQEITIIVETETTGGRSDLIPTWVLFANDYRDAASENKLLSQEELEYIMAGGTLDRNPLTSTVGAFPLNYIITNKLESMCEEATALRTVSTKNAEQMVSSLRQYIRRLYEVTSSVRTLVMIRRYRYGNTIEKSMSEPMRTARGMLNRGLQVIAKKFK